MKAAKKYTVDDIYDIIETRIKDAMKRKNAYIEKNGYHHRDVLKAFDTEIATLSGLYHYFK